MPNVSEMNQELVRAFNINLCYNNIAITNLTVQNLYDKDHIVISFNKNTQLPHRVKYLNALKDKIIRRSYENEEAAGVSYNLQSFPFNFKKGRLEKDNKGKRFLVEIDKDVIFNLKCYLAKALAGDVKERMGKKYSSEYLRKHIYNVSFDKNSYLYCMRFHDKRVQEDFVNLLSAQVRRYEENAPSDYLKVNGNLVYIKKSIFDNVEFIKDIAAHNASLICRDFQTPIDKDKVVENLKFPIIDFIRRIGIPIHSMVRTSYKGNNENSVLVPIVDQLPIDLQDVGRYLDSEEVYKINNEFGMEILSDVSESISAKLPRSGSFDGVIYGADFSDLDISYCVMNKIIENSVINEKHELSIDPELFARAVSRTPSLEEQPPLAEMSRVGVSPIRSQKEQIKESPRQVSEEPAGTGGRLYHTIDQPRSLSAAAVDVDESKQGACGGPFSPKSRMQVYHGQALAPLASGESDIESSGEHFKAESKENRVKSESPKKHSGGPRCSVKKSSSSETSLEKLASFFRRKDKKRHSMVSSFSAPGRVAIEKLPSPPWNSLPSRKSNPLLKEGSPAHSPSDDDAPVLLNKPNPNKVDLFQLPSDDSGIASASTSSSGDKLRNSMLSINSDIGLISSSKPDPLIHKRKYITFPLQNREYPRSLEPLSEMDATETESFPGGAAIRRSGRFSHADKITQQRQEDEGVVINHS